MKRSNSILLIIILLGLVSTTFAQTENLSVLSKVGDQDADGNTFSFVGQTSIGSNGDVGFIGTSQISSNVYLKDKETGQLKLTSIRSLTPPPPISGVFGTITFPKINDNGEVVFSSMIQGAGSTGGIFLATGGEIKKVALDRDRTPGGGFFEANLSRTAFFTINNRGEIAFFGNDVDTNGKVRFGLFLFSNDTLSKIVLSEDIAPEGGILTVSLNSMPALNDKGEVSFTVNNGDVATIYLFSNGKLKRIVGAGDSFNGETFQMVMSRGRLLNNLGQIAFLGRINNKASIFLASPDGNGNYVITRLIGEGDASPDGGTIKDLSAGLTPAQGGINSRGSVVIRATTTETDDGLFILIDGQLRKIVGKLEPTPLGGTFPVDAAFNSAFLGQQLSEDDRVVFESKLQTAAAERAIFIWSPETNNTPIISAANFTKKLLTIRATRINNSAELEINGKKVTKPLSIVSGDTITVKGSRKQLSLSKRPGDNLVVLIVDGVRSAAFRF